MITSVDGGMNLCKKQLESGLETGRFQVNGLDPY